MNDGNTEESRTSEHSQEHEPRPAPKKSKALLKFIHDTFDEIGALKLERKGINEKIKAALDELEAKGLDRKSIKAALSRYEMEEGERTDFDLTYRICLEACGIQGNLFGPDSGDEARVH